LGANMKRSSFLIGSAIAGVLSSPAWAQPAPQPATTPTSQRDNSENQPQNAGNAIVVTGSRVPRPDLDSASPVTVLGGETFQVDGETNVVRTLTEMPAFIGNERTPLDVQQAPGSFISLRGLGSLRTLTLVNGKRFITTLSDRGVDVSAIPPELIDRVEILTGGSSVTYGSDAITGVVNFILRDNFDGLEVNAQTGVTERGEATNRRASLTGGTEFADNRGSAWVHASWDRTYGITAGDRDFLNPQRGRVACPQALSANFRCAAGAPAFALGPNNIGVQTPEGTATIFNTADGFQRVFFNANGEIFSAPGVPNFLPVQTYEISGNTFTAVGVNRAGYLVLQQPQRRVEFAAGLRYNITDSIQFYGNGFYINEHSDRPNFPQVFAATLTFAVNDPFFGPLTQAFLVAKDAAETGAARNNGLISIAVARQLDELGRRHVYQTRNSYNLVGGIRWDMGGSWNLDANVSFNNSEYFARRVGEYNVNRIRQALDVIPGAGGVPQCRDTSNGCVPLNIFGAGKITPLAAAFIDGSSEFRGSMTDTDLQAVVTGEIFQLPAGPVGVSFGAERFIREASETPDQVLVSGSSSANLFNVFRGNLATNEVFGEAIVPIFRDRSFFDYLGLELGARYSRLNSGRHSWTYKILGEWSPIPHLKFRGGLQRAVRNPVAFELFGQETNQNQNLGDDPCLTGAPLTGLLRDRCILTGFPVALANSGAPAGTAIGTSTASGNPNLTPEVADTFTVGLVLRDLPVRNFSLTADYFDIRVDDLIGFVGTANIFAGCYQQAGGEAFCDRIDRDPVTGRLTAIRQDQGNLAKSRRRGIDVGVNYRINIPSLTGGSASFRIRATGTYMFSSSTIPFPLDPSIRFECAGFYAEQCTSPTQRVRTNTTFAWSDGPFSLSLDWQYMSGVTDAAKKYNVTLFPTLPVQRIPAANYFDLSAVWLITERFQLRLGVDNLFDREPVNVGSTRQLSLGGTYSRSYESIGRRFWAGARVRF